LSAGYIGAPGAADQTMANLISIGGIAYPVLVPDPAYTFAGFIIGGALPVAGGGGGGGGGGGSTDTPVTPPATNPVTHPGSITPPVTVPGVRPSFSTLLPDIARIQRSAEIMVLPKSLTAKLPTEPQCNADSAYTSCDVIWSSR
jgi:hypothetical protein